MGFCNFWPFHALNFVILLGLSTQDSCGTGSQNGCDPSPSNPKACRNNATYCDTINFQFCPPTNILRIYTTSDDGDRLRYSESALNCDKCDCGSDFTVNVDPCKTYQTIMGFGGAFTDSCVVNLQCLSQSTKLCFLNSYFNCAKGLGYNFIRTPLGSSDFSPKFYTLLDNCSKLDLLDPDLKCLSLTSMDRIKLEYIRAAISISCQCVHIIGAIWAAPEWMTATIPLLNRTYILPMYYEKWAQYHYKAAQAYSLCGNNENCAFYLSPGNEPEVGIVNPAWEIPQYQIYVKDYFCRKFQEKKCGVKLVFFDETTSILPVWQSLLEIPEINSCFCGTATHSYLDNLLQPYTTYAPDFYHEKYPDKFLVSSEFSICNFDGDYATTTDWEKAKKYIRDIIMKFTHWYQAYIDWNLCLDCEGGPNHRGTRCYSAIKVNCKGDEFVKNILFYALAHFSRAVPPGSVRIEATICGNDGSTNFLGRTPLFEKFPKGQPLELVAFKVSVPNCSVANVVVIILNPNEEELTGNICVTQYKCATVKMPANSIITAVLTLPYEFQCGTKC